MATKTYPQLDVQTTVEATDLLASWRSVGPLKHVAWSVLKADVLADVVSSDVTFTQAGTDPEPQSVQARLRGSIFITDYIDGVGDGTTTTDLAWTNAIAQCLASGKSLYVPGCAAYYKLTTGITVPANVKIWGDGYTSCIKQTVAETNVFTVAGDFAQFDGLNIEGTGEAVLPIDSTRNNGIYNPGYKGFKVQNCIIHGFQSCGVQMRDVYEWDVSHNLFYAQYWLFPEEAGNTCADILCYSPAGGGRGIAVANFCLSNNSLGIAVNILGADSDIILTANVCVTMTDDLTALVDSADLNRRHGIQTSYLGGTTAGRLLVNSNICRNTLVTGIYCAAGTAGPQMMTLADNLCSLNGYASTSDATLAGGIYVNRGALVTKITDNQVLDFQGALASSVGGIVVNGYDGGPEDIEVINNTVDTSTAYGIVFKGEVGPWIARGNVTRNITSDDIRVVAGTDSTCGFRLEQNDCRRINATANCIFIDTTSATATGVRFYVHANSLWGGAKATASTSNCAIRIRGTVEWSIKRNDLHTAYFGFFSESTYTAARHFSDYICDDNEFEDCSVGIAAQGASTAATVPFCGNIFINYIATIDPYAGSVCGYVAERFGAKLIVQTSAAPTTGTWIAGDRARYTAPAAGAAPGAVCTTGGNPGTWKAEASLAA